MMLTTPQIDLLSRIYDKPVDVICAHAFTTASLITRGLAEIHGAQYIHVTRAGKAIWENIGDISNAEPWRSYFPKYCNIRRSRKQWLKTTGK